MELFASITKDDVTLNNYLSRSKTLDYDHTGPMDIGTNRKQHPRIIVNI